MKKKILSLLLIVSLLISAVTLLTATTYAAPVSTCFCITNTSDEEATVLWQKENNPVEISLKYQIDDGEWNDVIIGTGITLPAKSSIYFKNSTNTFSTSHYQYYHVSCDKEHTVSGDITTLIKEEGGILDLSSVGQYIFNDIFQNDTELISAKNLVLPSTTLSTNCYREMFVGCTSLTVAPELPATNLAENCYYQMFKGCTSLTAAPELPATTVQNWSYQGMFLNCTSLTAAPELPATTLASSCYSSMFSGCTSLIKVPELPATTLAGWCYSNMFMDCSSLRKAPAIAATALASNCCYNMFKNCTSLIVAPKLLATVMADNCYSMMFMNCTSLKRAPELPATALANYCYAHMFNGCTSLTAAPELSATTLAQACYQSMFTNCKNLIYAPVLQASTIPMLGYYELFVGCEKLNVVTMYGTNLSADRCLKYWLKDCAVSGIIFVKDASVIFPDGTVPEGWTIKVGYTISTASGMENGTIDSVRTAAEGDTISLSPAPEYGYKFKSLNVKDSDGGNIEVTNNSFKMPAKDVTIYAEFEINPHTHNFVYAASGNVITATCDDGCNECWDTNPLTLTIAESNFVYDGQAKIFSFAASEVVSWKDATANDAPTNFVYTAKEGSTLTNGKAVNVGNYTVSITANGKTATLDFEITPKEVDIEWNTTAFTYNGQNQKPILSINTSEIIDGDTCTITKEAVSIKDGDTVANAISVGEYTIEALELSNVNYKVSENNGTNFVITKAQNTIRSITVNSWKDIDTPIVPIATADYGKVEFVFSKADEINFSIVDLPTEAGNYIVKAYVLGTDDYSATETVERTFTIYKTSLVPAENENVSQIIGSEKGIDPNAVIVVNVVSLDNDENVASVVKSLNDKDTDVKNDNIYGIYDVKLLVNNVEAQPNGKITIKMLVPSDIKDKEFQLYHIHKDASGNVDVSKVNYTDIAEDGTITFETDKLSQFVFVADPALSLLWLWILLIILLLLIIALIVYLYLRKKGFFNDNTDVQDSSNLLDEKNATENKEDL